MLILLDNNESCFCDCTDKCLIDESSIGSSIRRNKEKIEFYSGCHHHIVVLDEKSSKAIHDYYTIDGTEKTLEVRCIKKNSL